MTTPVSRDDALALAHRGAAAVDAALAACRSEAGRAALHATRPFLGVPLLLKDLGTAATDLPSRLGSRFTARITGPQGTGVHWPVGNTFVARWRAAGFIPFGRTTSPEMGISPSTEALAYGGPTRNPYDTAHSAGGSSDGAAAALAGGRVAIAHANDGAGSIRIPASCCGLVGLKPSCGLVPAGPLVAEGWDTGRHMAAFFARHDLLLPPVLTQPPAPLGRWAMDHPDFLDYRIGPEGLWRDSAYAPLANATGGASMALPAGLSSGGLPIGAMLTGQIGDDARLLVLAAELECAAP